MKKLTSLLLALVMALALAVPAFAEDTWPADKDKTKDVTATYTKESLTSTGNVYYVTIKWEATTETEALSYTGKQATYTWNGETMKYTENAGATEAKWEGAAGYKVTVTNQSNASVYATTTATNEYDLTLTAPTNAKQEITTAAVEGEAKTPINPSDTNKMGQPIKGEFTYKYAAKAGATAPTGNSDSALVVGRITVTVSNTNA